MLHPLFFKAKSCSIYEQSTQDQDYTSSRSSLSSSSSNTDQDYSNGDSNYSDSDTESFTSTKNPATVTRFNKVEEPPKPICTKPRTDEQRSPSLYAQFPLTYRTEKDRLRHAPYRATWITDHSQALRNPFDFDSVKSRDPQEQLCIPLVLESRQCVSKQSKSEHHGKHFHGTLAQFRQSTPCCIRAFGEYIICGHESPHKRHMVVEPNEDFPNLVMSEETEELLYSPGRLYDDNFITISCFQKRCVHYQRAHWTMEVEGMCSACKEAGLFPAYIPANNTPPKPTALTERNLTFNAYQTTKDTKDDEISYHSPRYSGTVRKAHSVPTCQTSRKCGHNTYDKEESLEEEDNSGHRASSRPYQRLLDSFDNPVYECETDPGATTSTEETPITPRILPRQGAGVSRTPTIISALEGDVEESEYNTPALKLSEAFRAYSERCFLQGKVETTELRLPNNIEEGSLIKQAEDEGEGTEGSKWNYRANYRSAFLEAEEDSEQGLDDYLYMGCSPRKSPSEELSERCARSLDEGVERRGRSAKRVSEKQEEIASKISLKWELRRRLLEKLQLSSGNTARTFTVIGRYKRARPERAAYHDLEGDGLEDFDMETAARLASWRRTFQNTTLAVPEVIGNIPPSAPGSWPVRRRDYAGTSMRNLAMFRSETTPGFVRI